MVGEDTKPLPKVTPIAARTGRSRRLLCAARRRVRSRARRHESNPTQRIAHAPCPRVLLRALRPAHARLRAVVELLHRFPAHPLPPPPPLSAPPAAAPPRGRPRNPTKP